MNLQKRKSGRGKKSNKLEEQFLDIILEVDDQWCFWECSSLWRLKEILKCLS